eukprot:7194870-Prymnesium_polylepis.1
MTLIGCSRAICSADFLVQNTPFAEQVESLFAEKGFAAKCDSDFAVTFIVINSLLFTFLQLVQIPAGVNSIASGAQAAKDCLKIISRIPSIDAFSDEGETPSNTNGLIEIEDVHFSYPSNPDFIICRGYSLQIPAGTSCALCGPSGSGKSTIVALLERFYDPLSGLVMLDGVDI